MSESLAYGYARLPSSTDHIRLLVSDRQHYDEVPLRTKLMFTFRTVSVDDCPNFIALSYEWGLPDDTEEILINGQVVAVRRNLAAALNQIRKLKVVLKEKANTPSLHLWVDALCIDQSNVQERSDQVLLMKRIYARASLVLIWLGTEANDSHTIIQGAISKAHPNFPSPDAQFRNNWFYRNMGEVSTTLVFVPPQGETGKSDLVRRTQREHAHFGGVNSGVFRPGIDRQEALPELLSETETQPQGSRGTAAVAPSASAVPWDFALPISDADVDLAFTYDEKKRAHQALIKQHRREQAFQTRFENAILALLSRTYWRRLWVVQEVLLANAIMFFCGTDYITWDDLCNYIEFQLGDGDVNLSREPLRKEFSGYSKDDVKAMASASALEWRMLSTPARELLEQTPGVDLIRAKTWWNPSYAVLHKAIIRWAPRECEDVRDKVFGLLGIISNERDLVAKALVPDYSVTVEELYSTLLESLLRTEEEWLETGQGLFMTIEERSTFADKLAKILRVKRRNEIVQEVQKKWNAKFLASRYDNAELALSSRPTVGLSEVWRATYEKGDDAWNAKGEEEQDGEWTEVARLDEQEDEPIFGEIQLDSPTA